MISSYTFKTSLKVFPLSQGGFGKGPVCGQGLQNAHKARPEHNKPEGKEYTWHIPKAQIHYIHYCEMSTTNQVCFWEWCNCLIEKLMIKGRNLWSTGQAGSDKDTQTCLLWSLSLSGLSDKNKYVTDIWSKISADVFWRHKRLVQVLRRSWATSRLVIGKRETSLRGAWQNDEQESEFR